MLAKKADGMYAEFESANGSKYSLPLSLFLLLIKDVRYLGDLESKIAGLLETERVKAAAV